MSKCSHVHVDSGGIRTSCTLHEKSGISLASQIFTMMDSSEGPDPITSILQVEVFSDQIKSFQLDYNTVYYISTSII